MTTCLRQLSPCLLMMCCPTLALLPHLGNAADAVPAPAPQATSGNGSADAADVIIIQATKRPEDIQQVPLSVTAYTSADIEESTDSQLDDLWQHTANTTQMDDHRSGMLSIRGIGYGASTEFGGEEKPTRGWSPIGFYVDGVSLEAQRGMSDFGSLYDVDTVELLRGPQGTLYGRGTLGGVVNVRTKDPTWTNEIEGSAYGGSYDEYRVDVAGGGPLSDTLAFRLALEKAGGNGYYDNITTGSDKTDSSNDFSARGKLLWKPTSALSVKAIVSASALSETTDSWVPLSLIDQRQTVTGDPGYDHGHGLVSSLEADYLVSAHTSATIVYGFGVANDAVDYDASRNASDAVEVTGANRVQDMSIEARLAHTGPDVLTWLAGIYAQQEKFDYTSLSTYSTTPFFGVPYYQIEGAAQAYNEDARVRDLNAAIYGEATAKLGAGFELTGGARLGYEHATFDWDEQITNQTNSAPPPATFPYLPFQDSESDHEPVLLPKGVLDYHASQDVLIYASVSRGYRPGGFNTGANTVAAAQSLYEPEYTWNYELGVKSTFDRVLTINASAFYIDWRNQQVPLTLPSPTFDEITVNAAHSHVYGAEFEAETKPVTGLRIWLSVGLLHATYDDYNFTGLNGNTVATGAVNESGMQFPNIPKYTAALGGFYQDRSGFFLGGTVSGQGATSVYFPNPPSTAPNMVTFNDYVVIDAKLGYRAHAWSVALIGRNLANKVYALNAIQIPADGVFTQTPQTYVREGPPRTVGVEVSAWW